MKCCNCLYFSENRCRRYPPTPTQYGDAIFPRVSEDNFCGEFAPVKKLDAAPEETLCTIPETMIQNVNVTYKPKRGRRKNA